MCVLLGIQKLEKCDWTPMAEQAINVVYFLAEHPDVICGNIVKQLAGCLTQKEDPRDDDPSADGQEQGIYRHVYSFQLLALKNVDLLHSMELYMKYSRKRMENSISIVLPFP